MKTRISFFSVLIAISSFLSCGKDEVVSQTENKPFKSLRLAVDETLYHASIDDEQKTLSIGSIQYGAYVSGVEYQLNPGWSISPEPEEFVGKWPEELAFTLSSENSALSYNLILTAYKGLNPGEGEGPDPSKIIFEDNFNQPNLIPDPEKWKLCKRTDPAWARYLSESYDQVFVQDGKLIVRAEMINGEYKTGGIETEGMASFKNARVEVNARFSKTAQGGWPAIWLMPQNPTYKGWPDGGEIDIMEQLNHDKIVYQTVHSYYKNTLGNLTPRPDITASYRQDQFNTYAVDLTDDALIFYVNGTETLRYANLRLADEAVKKQWPFSADFYLILNYALGGAGTWPGMIIDSQLPATMEVDWVRVSRLD